MWDGATFGIKVCSKCKGALPLTAFHKHRNCKGGIRSECKNCVRAYQRRPDILAARMARYQANLEENRARARKNYRLKRETRIDVSRTWSARNKDKVRDAQLKRNYGITLDDYNSMLAGQRGVCAICHGLNQSGKPLHVDHCHKSGVVRGLLCNSCNRGIGYLADDADRLLNAAKYVRGRDAI